jgi:putative selenate reductase molybdopterin-binding subunit
VIKPRIGGGFGKARNLWKMSSPSDHRYRPVISSTRGEEFIAALRHPMRIRMKTGVKYDGTITANAMYVLSDTGAYGCHALTVTGNTGHKGMALYIGDGPYRKSPNIRFMPISSIQSSAGGSISRLWRSPGFWRLNVIWKNHSPARNGSFEFRLKNAIQLANYIHSVQPGAKDGNLPETIETWIGRMCSPRSTGHRMA